MLSESFKCFFAVTVSDGPTDLALLSHIDAKVAICKSCEEAPPANLKIV